MSEFEIVRQIGEQLGPKVAEHLAGSLVERVVDRIFGPHLASRLKAVETAQTRMEHALDVVRARLSDIELAEISDELDDEPAVTIFIEECLLGSAQTPNEGKQLLFGDFIADRLVCATESLDDLALRQAGRIVTDCTSAQLIALARVMLVTDPPLSSDVPLPTGDVWDLVQKLDAATNGAADTWEDMRYLVSVNALTQESTRGGPEIQQGASRWASYLAAWQQRNVPFEVDAGLAHAIENRIRLIGRNLAVTGVENTTGVRYGDYDLTPAGHKIAVHLASRLTGLDFDKYR